MARPLEAEFLPAATAQLSSSCGNQIGLLTDDVHHGPRLPSAYALLIAVCLLLAAACSVYNACLCTAFLFKLTGMSWCCLPRSNNQENPYSQPTTGNEDMGWCCLQRPKQQENPYSHSVGGISAEKNIRLFSYSQLRSATDNFNRNNKVGRGGFGTVYKGTTRNMQEVAVKVLSAESRQGSREFLTEIDVISNVKHPNLVELIGCCVEGDHRILVYEYLENSSLDRALLGSNRDTSIFTWNIRSGICLGVAKGLAYLHEEIPSPIVHRDIKASNILIDKNYIPKIGDFGLAKLFPDNVTHISTRVAGTTGYLAPEYAWHGQLTKKADIYSFGVLVIEIISGLSGSRSLMAEDKLILEKTWELYEEGKLEEMVDPAVGTYPQEEAIRYLKVALFCTQAAAARRPSMPQVVKMMSKPIRINESELTAPGYISSEYKSSSSKAATASTDPRLKNSTTEDSDMFSTVVPQTVTDVSPR